MTRLLPGDVAPTIEANDETGKAHTIGGESLNKTILFFYPRDNTPGCTDEACNLRDNYDALLRAGYQIVGVSGDDENSHLRFKKKHSLPFPLIADTELSLCNAYGVYGLKKFMGREFMGINRTTFVIGTDGRLEKVITKVNCKNHTDQVLQ